MQFEFELYKFPSQPVLSIPPAQVHEHDMIALDSVEEDEVQMLQKAAAPH